MKIKSQHVKLWFSANAVLTGKFIASEAYIRKKDHFEFNNLRFCLKLIAKPKQTKSKTRKRKDIIKLKVEVKII